MEPVSAFAFFPALGGGRGFSLEGLLATHPPLDKRLAQLAKISAELGDR